MTEIIKPIVTEKMNAAGEKFNRYGFMVNRAANKLEIKKAVEDMYNVQVADVNTMVVAPKLKQRWTRSGLLRGKTNSYKKAVVTLKEGETIDFYSNI